MLAKGSDKIENSVSWVLYASQMSDSLFSVFVVRKSMPKTSRNAFSVDMLYDLININEQLMEDMEQELMKAQE